MFGVSLASIKRYLKQRRETGDLSPKAIPGRLSKKYAALEAGLVAQLETYPDSTLEAHCQLWESTHGMWVDHTTMSRAIRRVGWTRKKKRWVPTSGNEEERAAWRAEVSPLPANQLVFVDECGSNIALTPLYARAPKGKRAKGSVPRNRGKNTTLIASLSLESMGAAMILEGSANAAAFEIYVEQLLLPSLHSGQIVVMDNLLAPKRERVRQAIEAKGCQVLFLPGYSPDFSPIEETFSKRKHVLATSGSQNA